MSDDKQWRVTLARFREAILKARGFRGAERQVGLLMVEKASREAFDERGVLESWQSHEGLALDAELSVSGIRKCRSALVSAGALEIVGAGGNGARDTAHYAFREQWLVATEQRLRLLGIALDNAPRSPDQGSMFQTPKPARLRSRPCTVEQLTAYQPDDAISAWAARELPTLPDPLAPEIVASFKRWHIDNDVRPRNIGRAFQEWLKKEPAFRASRGRHRRAPAADRFAAGADRAAAKLKLQGEA